MYIRLSTSILKATSLSCAVSLLGAGTVLAQTGTTTAPQLPASPITEAAPQAPVTTTDGAPYAQAPHQSDGLHAPVSDVQISHDNATSPPPSVSTTDTEVAPTTSDANAPSETSQPLMSETQDAAVAPKDIPTPTPQTTTEQVEAAAKRATSFLQDGGPSIWAIAALSVITVALILWKTWRLALIGAWARGKAQKAVNLYEEGNTSAAQELVSQRRGLRSKVVGAAIHARETLTEDAAREETSRVAKRELGEAAVGLRALELIATIAPLLGLLGTVLGMIAAFQALQESGSRADPSLLAGGIWEALLTTAAGMAVAIPASAALTWFEAVIDRMRRDIEDAAMRIFVTRKEVEHINVQALAAE